MKPEEQTSQRKSEEDISNKISEYDVFDYEDEFEFNQGCKYRAISFGLFVGIMATMYMCSGCTPSQRLTGKPNYSRLDTLEQIVNPRAKIIHVDENKDGRADRWDYYFKGKYGFELKEQRYDIDKDGKADLGIMFPGRREVYYK